MDSPSQNQTNNYTAEELESSNLTDIKLQLRWALDEINEYRRLLSLPTLTKKDIPRWTNQILSQTAPSHCNERLSIMSLPLEVLDLIIGLLDVAKDIISFCHAIPVFKHISKSIYDVGIAFNLRPKDIWPTIVFPRGMWLPKPIPLHTVVCISKLVRLLNKYNGAAKIMMHSIEYIDSIHTLLPSTVDLYVPQGGRRTYAGQDSYPAILRNLDVRKIHVRSLDIPCDFRAEHVTSALSNRKISVLRCFDFGDFPLSVLPNHPSVTEIQFEVGFHRPRRAIEELLRVLPKTRIESVCFEDVHHQPEDALIEFQGAQELEQIGWIWIGRIGPFQGKPCVQWRKKKHIL